MMAVIDAHSEDLIAKKTFLGTPLKEIQPKTQQVNQPGKSCNGIRQTGMQPKSGEVALSGPVMRSAAKENVPMLTNSGGGDDMRGFCEDVEQALHPKNVNSNSGGTHSIQLQPAAGWYAANENRPMSTMPGNPMNNNIHSGNLAARAEKGKSPSPDLIITAIRPCRPSAAIPNAPSHAKNAGAQMKPRDVPRANQTIKIEGEEPTRQQSLRQAMPTFGYEFRQSLNEANDRLRIADMQSHIDSIWEEQPLASQHFRSKQEMFDRMFYGKTVTEIQEILGKRKRPVNNEEIENMPLRKKIDQHRFSKK
jgi:hypothetical protein